MPGAMSIPLRPEFATWLGWLVPADTAAGRSCATDDQDPRRDRLAGRARSATTSSPASSTAACAAWLAAGEPDADYRLRHAPSTSTAAGCSTSARPPSTPPGTCPARCMSSSATLGHAARSATRRADRGDVRPRRAGDERRQPARTAPATTTSPCSTADPRTGPTPPAGRWRPARERRPHRREPADRARAAAPTSPSSACWSPSTPWSAACSARNAPCCRCWPSSEFGLTRLHRRPDLHPGLRRGQGRHQLLRRHAVGPLRPQTRAGRRLAGRRCRCRCC